MNTAFCVGFRRARVALVFGLLAFGCALSAGAATRWWTGAAGDNRFFNPTNWSTKTSWIYWGDTVYFTNDVPLYLDMTGFAGHESCAPRYVYVRGADVLVVNQDFRLHGANVTPPSFIDVADGSRFVVSNSQDRTSGSNVSFNNYNSGEIVKKGKGTVECWGWGGNYSYQMTTVAPNSKLRIEEGEFALRTQSGCGCYLQASEITVDKGATLTAAGGYNSSVSTAPWTIDGTVRLYTGSGDATACAAINGTGVITNVPWSTATATFEVYGAGGIDSAFAGTVPSEKIRFQLKKDATANDGYFRVTRADLLKDSGGISFRGEGKTLSFAAGIGSFDLGRINVYDASTTSSLDLEDVDGEPVTVTAALDATPLQRLRTTGAGGLVVSGATSVSLGGANLRHQGVLSLNRPVTFGDGTDAANDFDFSTAPRRIELHGASAALTVKNVDPVDYTGTLAADNASAGWSFATPSTIARVERVGDMTASEDITINGGYFRNCYSFKTADDMTITLNDTDVSYSSTIGLNFKHHTGVSFVYTGGHLDLSAYDTCGPMTFEQRGGEVRFMGDTYAPPNAATEADPATYLFAGGVTRFTSGTPFNSTKLHLLAGASGAKFRGKEGAYSTTATINFLSPFKSGVAAPGTDGGLEIDLRSWCAFRYPLEITGPFALVGSGALIAANASFDDGTQFFGTGDLSLDTSEITFYPRTGSKTVNLATGEGQTFTVKGSSLLSARYRDPNSGKTGDANHFVIREPTFGDAGVLALFDRVTDLGTDGASSVKLASGAPAMSATGRVLKPIILSGKFPSFATYDATAGFRAYSGGVTAVSDCTASTVLRCTKLLSPVTFPKNSTNEVEAVYCDDWGSFSVPATSTLKIGDGTNPGMVLTCGQRGVYGGGTLDFRGAPARFVIGCPGSDEYRSEVTAKIANASSVSYLGLIDESSTYYWTDLTRAQDYACDTYISAIRVHAQNEACFSTGRVHLLGGMRKGGQITFDTAGTWANDMTIRGGGRVQNVWETDTTSLGTAALSFYANATLAGDIAVDDFARLSARTNTVGTFTGTVSGGTVNFHKMIGEIVFAGHNTYAGGTFLEGGTFTLKEADSVGTGAIRLANTYGTATLNFANAGDIVFTNDVTGTGVIRLSGVGAVAFTAPWASSLPFARFAAGTVLKISDGAVDAAGSAFVPAIGGDVDLGGATVAVNGLVGSGTVSNGTLVVTGDIQPGGAGAVGQLTLDCAVTFAAGARLVAEDDGTAMDRLALGCAADISRMKLLYRVIVRIRSHLPAQVLTATAISGKPEAFAKEGRGASHATMTVGADAVTILPNSYGGAAIIVR